MAEIYNSAYTGLIGAQKGVVEIKPGGGTHHTLIGGVSPDGKGVRVSWDQNRHGSVKVTMC
jgi:hypothetical protein